WKDTGVQGKKTGQGMVPIVSAADDDALEVRPEDRYHRHEVGRDFGGPKTFLVPGQQVTSEGEGEHQLQQDDAEPEVDFARSLVRAVNDDLHQVQRQQDDHHMRGVVVQSAQEPASYHDILDVIDTFPGCL